MLKYSHSGKKISTSDRWLEQPNCDALWLFLNVPLKHILFYKAGVAIAKQPILLLAYLKAHILKKFVWIPYRQTGLCTWLLFFSFFLLELHCCSICIFIAVALEKLVVAVLSF